MHGVAHHGRSELSAVEHRAEAEVAAAKRAGRLVGVDRNQHQRRARCDGREDRVEPGVADRDVRMRKQLGQRHVLLDAHIRGRYAELARIAVAADRYDEVERLAGEPFDIVSNTPGVRL